MTDLSASGSDQFRGPIRSSREQNLGRGHISNRAAIYRRYWVKGPRSRYNGEEVRELTGVRKLVMEYFRKLDAVLADLERSGVTIVGEKSKFCMAGLKIVGYICDSDGRHTHQGKVAAILEWPDSRDVHGARAFLGICVCYRIWIEDFAFISIPVVVLFRKDVIFVWGLEQRFAMDQLEVALTTAPALMPLLMPLDYSEGAGEIICGSYASLLRWGGYLA